MQMITRFARRHAAAQYGFANGAFLATMFFLAISNTFEKRLFHRIATHATVNARTQQDSVLALLPAAHVLVSARSNLLAPLPSETATINDCILLSSDGYLLGSDACGSYASALTRLLQGIGRPARVVQMQCGDQPGCHIFTEAQVGDSWVALDPTYNLVFRTPSGRLASAAEMSANWGFYRAQVPQGYDSLYSYDGMRYTNWSKIPNILPAIRWVAGRLGIRQIETLSLRSKVRDLYHTYLLLLLLPYACVLFFTARKVARHHAAKASLNVAAPQLLPQYSERVPSRSGVKILRPVDRHRSESIPR